MLTAFLFVCFRLACIRFWKSITWFPFFLSPSAKVRSKVASRVTTRTPALRRYGQAVASESAAQVRLYDAAPVFRRKREPQRQSRQNAQEDDFVEFGEKPFSESEHSARLAEHLNSLFSPLLFPPDLAHRILTHASHVSAKYGSNGSLSFSGRRVLECYLNLFLNASSALKPTHDLDQIAEHTLNNNLLGQHLGSRWGYNKIIQWTPAVSRAEIEQTLDADALIRRIGLYKVQGDAVAATLGGIYFQFGGSIAHRVFHTRMLPFLLVNGGLPSVFHDEAQAVAKRMGGLDGNLLNGSSSLPSSSSS